MVNANLRSKKDLYGDMLRANSIAWRVLGFPVEELVPLTSRFHTLLYTLIWPYLCGVHEMISTLPPLDEKLSNWDKVFIKFNLKPLSLVKDAVILVVQVIQLLGFSAITLDFLKAAIEL